MMLVRTTIDTPVGAMIAVATESALCALEFDAPGRLARLDARVARWFDGARTREGSCTPIERTRTWLDRYFGGASADVSELALDMRGNAFELTVWQALRQLQPGETTTYGTIAKRIGSPGAARAVGLANGANPIAIIVPCHRVIGANGTLTGYGGGLDRKRWLLNHERRWRNALPL
jgi:O-6-methylguanine DNA methyltransferase